MLCFHSQVQATEVQGSTVWSGLVHLLFDRFASVDIITTNHCIALVCSHIVHAFVLLLLSSVLSEAARSRREGGGGEETR